MKVYRAQDRGHVEHGWLKAKHSFSFGEYYNPQAMSFGPLRVLNEDVIEAGQGFGTHPHKDAEILTYVLSGGLRHEDSMGNGGVIEHGDVQYMSAGKGIRHSEFNASRTEPVHLYQIWILPHTKGLKPRYEQESFSPQGRANQWQLIASPKGDQGSFQIAQDAKFLVSELDQGRELTYKFENKRKVWLQLARGAISVNHQDLSAGDAISFEEAQDFSIEAIEDAELLLFDMA